MSIVAHKSDRDRLVQHGFFEPLGPKWKSCAEKNPSFLWCIHKWIVEWPPNLCNIPTPLLMETCKGGLFLHQFPSCPWANLNTKIITDDIRGINHRNDCIFLAQRGRYIVLWDKNHRSLLEMLSIYVSASSRNLVWRLFLFLYIWWEKYSNCCQILEITRLAKHVCKQRHYLFIYLIY